MLFNLVEYEENKMKKKKQIKGKTENCQKSGFKMQKLQNSSCQ